MYISSAKYSREDEVKARLRSQALADAKKSAQQTLSGTGDSVGRILYISAGRAYVQARMVGTGVTLYSAKATVNDMAERYAYVLRVSAFSHPMPPILLGWQCSSLVLSAAVC